MVRGYPIYNYCPKSEFLTDWNVLPCLIGLVNLYGNPTEFSVWLLHCCHKSNVKHFDHGYAYGLRIIVWKFLCQLSTCTPYSCYKDVEKHLMVLSDLFECWMGGAGLMVTFSQSEFFRELIVHLVTLMLSYMLYMLALDSIWWFIMQLFIFLPACKQDAPPFPDIGPTVKFRLLSL